MGMTTAPDATPDVPRWHVVGLVAVPVVVFGLCAVATLMFVAWVRFMSAMGHGHLSASEAIPLWAGGWAVAIVLTTVAVKLVERGILGPASARTEAQRAVTWRTRVATAFLSLMLPVAVPPLARDFYRRQEVAYARHGSEQDRFEAIQALGEQRTARAYRALRDIALDRADSAYIRGQAAYALAEYPEGKQTLLTLAEDAPPEMLGAVGAGLLLFADDPRAWAVIERLARDERELVRRPMQQALRYGRMHQGAVEKRRRLLEAIAAGGSTTDALAAAAELGTAGFDRALAVLTDTSQDDQTRIEAIEVLARTRDERAIAPLLDVVFGRAAPGFVPAATESAYRSKAAQAIASIQGYTPEVDLLTPYNLEHQALFDARAFVKAQNAYAKATGFFDGRLSCLELPATCAPGRDADESFLAPSLTRDRRHGYLFRLEPAPSPSAAEIAARRASASSVRGFAYVATPEAPGRTGISAFCADDTGAVCSVRSGRRPLVRDGRCVMQPAPEVQPSAPWVFYDSVTQACEVRR
jgi:HEAT repeat protein